MSRRLFRHAGIAVCGLVLLIAAVTSLGRRWTPRAVGQEGEADVPQAELLMRDIHFLELLRNLDFTAAQRQEAAKAIKDFQDKRKAIEALGETEGLLQALAAVRSVLLESKPPTDEMREAVEAARAPDDGTVDRAFADARREVVEQLVGLLTEEQKEQLQMMPLVEFANQIINMSFQARGMDDEEFRDWRRMVTAEAMERFRVAEGEGVEAMNTTVQDAISRFRAMDPDQLMAQRDQLVPGLVSALKDALPQNPQAAWDRLADQLWEWVVTPGVAALLEESAAAMAAE
jgi:hypothetical protein